MYRTEETDGGTDDLEARVGLGRDWATQWDTLAEQADWTEGELVIEGHRKGKAREVQFEVAEPEGGGEAGDWMELYLDWVHVDGTPCEYAHAEWTSAGGGDFNTPASWSTGEVPLNQWNAGQTAFVKATDVTLPDVGEAFAPVTVAGSHFVNELLCDRGSEMDPGLVIEGGGVLRTWEHAEIDSDGHIEVQPGGRLVADQSFGIEGGGQVHLLGDGDRNDEGDIAVGHRLYLDGKLYVTDATLKAGYGLTVHDWGGQADARFVSTDPGVNETVAILDDVLIGIGKAFFGEGTRTEVEGDFSFRDYGEAPEVEFDGTLYLGRDFLVQETVDMSNVDFSEATIIFHNDEDSEMQVRGDGADPFLLGRLELESGNLTLVGAPEGYLYASELVLGGSGTIDLGGMTLECDSFTGDEAQVTNGLFIPEPTSLALFGLGAAGLLKRRRRQGEVH